MQPISKKIVFDFKGDRDYVHGAQISLLSSVGHECKIGRKDSVAGNVVIGGASRLVMMCGSVRVSRSKTLFESARMLIYGSAAW